MSGRELKNRCRLHGDGLGSGAPIDARIGEAVEAFERRAADA
jgi:hypothetical protein